MNSKQTLLSNDNLLSNPMTDQDEEGHDDDNGDFFDSTSNQIEEDDSLLQSHHPPHDRPFNHLTESDILDSIKTDSRVLSTVLNINEFDAIVLLLHCNWSVSKVHDAWFTDEIEIRKRVGLHEEQLNMNSFESDDHEQIEINCKICFDSHPRKDTRSLNCGHRFCRDCWSTYISTAIEDGAACLYLKCPEPKCGAAVNQRVVSTIATHAEMKKYYQILASSYVEENKKKIKWCPAPDCEYAVSFELDSGLGNDVSCLCSHKFCCKCLEEAHRPVDCETVKKWIGKSDSEAENLTWLLAYTKPCPQCKKPIEKNNGCNIMTCRPPCSFKFCWYCLQPLLKHDYGSCGRFTETPNQEQKEAKKHMDRYTHYYVRFDNNKRSMKKAMKDLQAAKKLKRKIHSLPEALVGSITDAWEQVIQCRRVLQWSYAYGYYIPEEEKTKRQLFEFLQIDAESSLERLHEVVEHQVQQFLVADATDQRGFKAFRSKLVSLTNVTKTYFENLVAAFENGLSDVSSSSSSSCNQKKRGREDVRIFNRRVIDRLPGKWICLFCTFYNDDSVSRCQICLSPALTMQYDH